MVCAKDYNLPAGSYVSCNDQDYMIPISRLDFLRSILVTLVLLPYILALSLPASSFLTLGSQVKLENVVVRA